MDQKANEPTTTSSSHRPGTHIESPGETRCHRPCGESGVHFKRTPNVSPPVMPSFTFNERRRDGEMAGYPGHLCHLIEYAWATTLPETAICRKYVEWFVQECPCFSYGIMLMTPENFAKQWGPNMQTSVELTILSKGCPPLLWSLTCWIDGYDTQTDSFFDPHEDETAGAEHTRTTLSGSLPPDSHTIMSSAESSTSLTSGSRTFESGGDFASEPPENSEGCHRPQAFY